MALNVLFLHAHPDDAEFLAAGTLAALAETGHAIVIATLSDGDCGSAQFDGTTLGAMRREEAARAAASIGAAYHWAGFHDLSIFVDDAARRRVTEVLRRHRPDIVLTASPEDYHCDHEAAGRLARDACFAAACPNYATGAPDAAPATERVPHLYFADPTSGVDRNRALVRPDFVVDIGAALATKRAMLACHVSQRDWLKRQHGMDDMAGMMEDWSRQRGALAGLTHGEGFRQYKGYPFPDSPLLQQLLGTLVSVPLRA